jgi:MFS family permease
MPDAGPGALAWTGRSDKRSYYKLFLAYVMALLATGVATVALALFAFELTGDDSGVVLGTALSLKMLAYVVAAPVAAAATERLARKPLLVALDLVRAASLMLLPFLRELWQIFALVFVFALASATFTLVYQTVTPYLLGSAEDYTRSLVRSRIASDVENSVSPLLAAGLLLLLVPFGIFLAMAAAFLASAVLVQSARLPRHLASHPHGIWAKVLRGPRLFLATPDLRGLLALDVAVALATAMVMVNTVVIVQGIFDLDRRATALAFALFGFGCVAGAFAMPGLLRLLPERGVMLGGAALLTAGLLLGSRATTLHAIAPLWLLLGLGAALALTPAGLLIRRIARPEDLQTLFAAQFSISNACLLVAYSAAGWLGAVAGMPTAFLALGLGAAAATAAAAWLWPTARADAAPPR